MCVRSQDASASARPARSNRIDPSRWCHPSGACVPAQTSRTMEGAARGQGHAHKQFWTCFSYANRGGSLQLSSRGPADGLEEGSRGLRILVCQTLGPGVGQRLVVYTPGVTARIAVEEFETRGWGTRRTRLGVGISLVGSAQIAPSKNVVQDHPPVGQMEQRTFRFRSPIRRGMRI